MPGGAVLQMFFQRAVPPHFEESGSTGETFSDYRGLAWLEGLDELEWSMGLFSRFS